MIGFSFWFLYSSNKQKEKEKHKKNKEVVREINENVATRHVTSCTFQKKQGFRNTEKK